MPLPSWLNSFIGFGWIRDLLGIRKDFIDTKKSKLEVKKLEHEERVRSNLITPATLDDVKKYDPKARELEELLNRHILSSRRRYYIALILLLMGLLLVLTLWLLSR